MSHIQIAASPFPITYQVGGSPRSNFPITGPYFADTDIVVTIDGVTQVLNTDYTVTGNLADSTLALGGGYSSGEIDLDVAVTDAEVEIDRFVPVERTTDFPNSGPLDIPALNTQLDKLVAIAQQTSGRMDTFSDDLQAAEDLFESLNTEDLTVSAWPSRAAAALADISDAVSYIRTGGYAAAGDGGHALYKRAVSPSIVNGAFQTENDVWFELVPQTLSPMMFGTRRNGSADDFIPFQAALNAASELGGEVVDAGGGVYVVSDTLVVPEKVQLRGVSEWATEIRSTAAAKPVIELVGSAGGRNCVIRDLTVSHTGTVATSGGHGVSSKWGGNYHVIENVTSANNWDGFNVSPIGWGVLRNCKGLLNYNNGFTVADSAISIGPLQWLLYNCIAEANDAHGLLIKASFGPSAFGTLNGFRTFANGGSGIKVEGTALTYVSSLNFSNLFLGGDNGTAEVFIDSYWTTGEIQITDFFIEQCGSATAGRAGSSAIFTNAHGIRISANNGRVSLVNGTITSAQNEGIVQFVDMRLSAVKIIGCGQAGTGYAIRIAGAAGTKLDLNQCRLDGTGGTHSYNITGPDGADVRHVMTTLINHTVDAESYSTGSSVHWP